jgi:hypothetical protein
MTMAKRRSDSACDSASASRTNQTEVSTPVQRSHHAAKSPSMDGAGTSHTGQGSPKKTLTTSQRSKDHRPISCTGTQEQDMQVVRTLGGSQKRPSGQETRQYQVAMSPGTSLGGRGSSAASRRSCSCSSMVEQSSLKGWSGVRFPSGAQPSTTQRRAHDKG